MQILLEVLKFEDAILARVLRSRATLSTLSKQELQRVKINVILERFLKCRKYSRAKLKKVEYVHRCTKLI